MTTHDCNTVYFLSKQVVANVLLIKLISKAMGSDVTKLRDRSTMYSGTFLLAILSQFFEEICKK